MKKLNNLVVFLLSCFIAVSCATLRPVTVNQSGSMKNYQYFYITPTGVINSTSGGIYGGDFGVYGTTSTRSANPADLISGYLLKKGYIKLPDLDPNLLEKTLVINYGQSGSRGVFWGTVTEVTLQFLSADTMRPVCIISGEGFGSTEAEDIKIAINRCLNKLFE